MALNWNLSAYLRAVIGTIPSIPIPFANFGIELTPNSNSTLGIGATTPTPIQRNWGIPRDSNVCLKSVEKVEKRCEPGVTSVFLLLVKPGWREGNSNTWNSLESPHS